jgi:hypothetical protein
MREKYITHMEMRNNKRIEHLSKKLSWKRPLMRPRSRQEDCIKMDLKQDVKV